MPRFPFASLLANGPPQAKLSSVAPLTLAEN
jgi:hypothetical protein